MKRITSAYEELTEVVSESEAEEQYQRFESIQADHLKMTGCISKWISDVEMDLNEGLSMRSRSSRGSRSSRSSDASKRAEAASEAA